MPQHICPTCGDRYYVASPDVMLTARQQNIYDALSSVSRRTRGRTASTVAIAADVGWSVTTVWRELVYLEQIGEVERPNGPRKGWGQVVRHGIKAVALTA